MAGAQVLHTTSVSVSLDGQGPAVTRTVAVTSTAVVSWLALGRVMSVSTGQMALAAASVSLEHGAMPPVLKVGILV